MKEVNNKSGNLKNLNLGMLDSITATMAAKTKTLAKRMRIAEATAAAFKEFAIPHGKNRFAPIMKNIISLPDEAHSIRANLFPEYSRIIAS